MNEEITNISRLLTLLRQVPAPPEAAFEGLLHSDLAYARLATRISGRAAVLAELQKDATHALMQRLHWGTPHRHEAGVRLIGEAASGSKDRSLIFMFLFRDGLVSEVQQQFGAVVAPEAKPLVLTEEISTMINQALETHHPMLLAYTDENDQPRLSFRGSVRSHGANKLALWVRDPAGHFIKSLATRPRVALMYRNEESRATYQFQGAARLATSDEERRKIYDAAPQVERDHDFAMIGAAVVIDLDRVEGYSGVGANGQMNRVLMRSDLPQR